MEFRYPLTFGLQRQDSSSLDVDEEAVKFTDLPIEIHSKILSYVDISDILTYATTCKLLYRYADSQQLWKIQWIRLSQKTPFTYVPTSTMSNVCVNFKDSCRRLWRVMVYETATFGGLNPVKCLRCREYTCTPTCIEERTCSKVSIDIGSKMSWILCASFTLKRHLSMIALPKTLVCFDCDMSFDRDDVHCDCKPNFVGYCQNQSMASHSGLEYRSQSIGNLQIQPFCLFCEEKRVNALLCEREIVRSTKRRYKSTSEEEFLNHETFLPLKNGYCRDTAAILGADNLDLLSPHAAFDNVETFPVLKSYLSHILMQEKRVDSIQAPNSSLILSIPTKIPHSVKETLLKFFFEETKASRVCLLPKALAIAQLFNVGTCVVVDSGATKTSVDVVIEGKVEETRSQKINVGGWHVSQFLKQALDWQNHHGDYAVTTVSSLDTSAVKSKCRISLNLDRESSDLNKGLLKNATQAVSETLHIKSQRDTHRKLELTEVTLSSELFLAPEMMYSSLELPAMVVEATKDLPDHILKECFSHILLTGGNTELRGFDLRFSRDLRELLPEHSPIINVCSYPGGNKSLNTVMGAHAVPVPIPYENILHDPGRPIWMTREEYITFGSQRLASDLLDEEG